MNLVCNFVIIWQQWIYSHDMIGNYKDNRFVIYRGCKSKMSRNRARDWIFTPVLRIWNEMCLELTIATKCTSANLAYIDRLNADRLMYCVLFVTRCELVTFRKHVDPETPLVISRQGPIVQSITMDNFSLILFIIIYNYLFWYIVRYEYWYTCRRKPTSAVRFAQIANFVCYLNHTRTNCSKTYGQISSKMLLYIHKWLVYIAWLKNVKCVRDGWVVHVALRIIIKLVRVPLKPWLPLL